MSSFVGLQHYGQQGLSGFGSQSWSQFDQQEIMKALVAGRDDLSLTNGPALKVESLEASLKVLTHTSKNIKFWRNINKSPAYSTVEAYNQVSEYGGAGGAFLDEGQLPGTTDSKYHRKTEIVKFIGTVREVTHPASLTNSAHGPLVELANKEGILWIMQRVEESLFKGDASLLDQSWNGLDALIDSSSFIDLAGDPLSESAIEESSQILIENFAFPNEAYMPVKVKSNLVKTLQSRQRFPMPYASEGRIGQSIKHMETDGGDVALEGDVFLKKQPPAPATAQGPAGSVPSTPASIAGVLGGATGDFTKSQSSDSRYFYVATAVNQYGESASSAPSAAVDIDQVADAEALKKVGLTVVAGATPGDFYRVYRTEARAQAGAAPAVGSFVNGRPAYSLVLETAALVVDDENFIMPNTSIAYIGENTEQVLTFRQLAPLMKMDLGVVAPSYRWMVLLYGTPMLFAPKKWLRIVNIGDLQ